MNLFARRFRLFALIFALSLLPFSVRLGRAQDATAVPTGPANEIQGFLVVCDTAAVINFTGTLLAGWDIYFQIVAGGQPLTALRQVQAGGTVAYSERVAYNSGQTVAAGASASAVVKVARETNADAVDFEFTLTDVQDGCAEPQNPAGTSVDTDATLTGGAAATSNVVRILAPNGLVLNPNLQPEPEVVIGPRQSDRFRSETPGLIFAECDEAELALPGIVYDNDSVTVFWSWFTRTQAQMEQHLATAQYSVKMNTAAFPTVERSEIVRRSGLYWVFYTAPVGYLRPGHYEVEYRVTWTEPHFDGYDNYGPGTERPVDSGNCNFDVTRNPSNESVVYTGMFFPTEFPVYNLFND